MIGVCEFFTFLTEKDLDLEIELGDDAKYKAVGHGTVAFQRESGKQLLVKDVLYVPGLTNNLLSISVLEEKGYVVTFMNGKVLIPPKGSNLDSTKIIGIKKGKLYRL